MDIALQLADEAAALQEVPVGCIVVKNDTIIGRGFNRRETWADPTAHAECIALRDAAKTIGQWRLVECTVYCTMEPCPMCTGALIHARIQRLVYGCSDPKAGCCGSLYELHQESRFNHRFEVTQGIRAEEAANKLRDFFKARRKAKKNRSA
jgi:tRNA(adenine34) deaminase